MSMAMSISTSSMAIATSMRSSSSDIVSKEREKVIIQLWLYNETCGLFDPIRIMPVVIVERSYLFSLVLAFYTLTLLPTGKDILRSYFIQCS